MRALVENYILLFFVTAMLGWVMDGTIRDSKTVAAVLKYNTLKEKR